MCVRTCGRILILFLSMLAPALAAAADSTSLCSSGEERIFSCRTRHQVYEICVSGDISPTSGYMQYRAGKKGKTTFEFPPQRLIPTQYFQFELLPRGAQISFRNAGFTYEIVEPLIGTPHISVSSNDGKTTATINCLNHSDGLTLTTTQDKLKSWSLYQ